MTDTDPLVQGASSKPVQHDIVVAEQPATAMVMRPPANVVPIDQLCAAMAKSGFFADIREAGQAIVKVQAGAELGIGPVASMTQVYIVKGRVSLSANLMATMVKRSGRYDYRVRTHDANECSIDFFERAGGQRELIGNSSFTMEDAKTAGIGGGDNWRKYPRNMLFARAMSNGVRTHCPDVTSGNVYTPDELGLMVGEDGEALPAQPAAKPEADKSQPKVATRTERAEADKTPAPPAPILAIGTRWQAWQSSVGTLPADPEAKKALWTAWVKQVCQIPDGQAFKATPDNLDKLDLVLKEVEAAR